MTQKNVDITKADEERSRCVGSDGPCGPKHDDGVRKLCFGVVRPDSREAAALIKNKF